MRERERVVVCVCAAVVVGERPPLPVSTADDGASSLSLCSYTRRRRRCFLSHHHHHRWGEGDLTFPLYYTASAVAVRPSLSLRRISRGRCCQVVEHGKRCAIARCQRERDAVEQGTERERGGGGGGCQTRVRVLYGGYGVLWRAGPTTHGGSPHPHTTTPFSPSSSTRTHTKRKPRRSRRMLLLGGW